MPRSRSRVRLPRKVDRWREHLRPAGHWPLRRLEHCVVDERVEATVERHAYRAEHLVGALGEGPQHGMRALIGVPKCRFDEALKSARSASKRTFPVMAAGWPRAGRAPTPFMEENGRAISPR